MKAIAIKMMPILIKLELEEKRRIMVDSLKNENLRESSWIGHPVTLSSSLLFPKLGITSDRPIIIYL
jgi:hypothetical protein